MLTGSFRNKRSFLLLLSVLLFSSFAQAQKEKEKEGKTLNGYYDQKVFKHPEKGAFLETYLSIDGRTLHYADDGEGKKRSKLRVTARILSGDSIVAADKTISQGPSPLDHEEVPDLVDVKRFALDSGYYDVRIDLEDLNADSVKTFTIRSSVNIPDFEQDSLMFSDIELVDRFQKSSKRNRYTKSGYRLIPYISNIYPKERKKLNFYAELYNSKKVLSDTGEWVLRTYIYNLDQHKPVESHYRNELKKAGEVIPVFRSWNIEDLPAGNYSVVVEARSLENELITKHSAFFQRKVSKEERKKDMLARKIEDSFVEQFDDPDSLRMYIRALRPRADPVEEDLIKSQVEVMNMKTMKRFMYSFWVSRDNEEPGKAWKDYKELVDHTNEEFEGTYEYGFQTDRGRVMLEYGKPDRTVERKAKPHSYPYEIWQYYEIGQYTDKRFVFYDPDLVGNDYRLLHSDMPGELRNRRWRRDLQDRQNVMDDVDEEGTRDHYGREVDDLFRNP